MNHYMIKNVIFVMNNVKKGFNILKFNLYNKNYNMLL